MVGGKKIKKWLTREILLLDGAIGTELQKRGMPPGVSPESWCLDHPEILQQIHERYVNAGSRLIYTASFGANPFKLRQYHLDRTREINRDLARICRRAAGRSCLVAGSIGPSGHMVEPFGTLPFEDAVAGFKEQVRGLVEGGVDIFVIETMIDIQEARAALLAVKELGEYYTIVTVTLEENGRTLGGTDPVAALVTLQSLGADAVGCNCSAGPDTMAAYLDSMKPFATVPLVAKPNAGVPVLKEGKTVFPMTPQEFGSLSHRLIAAGATMIGGCCGSTPEHIAALRRETGGVPPVKPLRKNLGAVSSGRDYRIIEPGGPLLLVGERINPTGKKYLQEELLAGKDTLIRSLARQQEEQGADLLDLNLGMPGIDEAQAMRKAVAAISNVSRLPLVIDSADPAAVAAALRLYPGRALVNSITLEDRRLKEILPLAARYGAMIIILPLTEGGLPEGTTERAAAARKIFAHAKTHGYSKKDIVVDGLVLTAASRPDLALEALSMVDWCGRTFHCASLLGLTNISFGMPGRGWLNSAYLAMAHSRGLTMAIADPASTELMGIKKASDLLTGNDKGAKHYLSWFADKAAATPPEDFAGRQYQSRIFRAVLDGNREEIVPLLEEALAAGVGAGELMDQALMKAIGRVGELFEEKVFFLPQLIASAETMQAGVGRIEKLLPRGKQDDALAGTIVLATVKGDIHDIGKNIVALLLRNAGHRVIDLGKDVAPEVIIAAAREHRPDMVGLSALMTTTMAGMKEVIDLARSEGLSCPFILGGAVVTEDFARSLGALYGRDGVEAVRVVARLLKERACQESGVGSQESE